MLLRMSSSAEYPTGRKRIKINRNYLGSLPSDTKTESHGANGCSKTVDRESEPSNTPSAGSGGEDGPSPSKIKKESPAPASHTVDNLFKDFLVQKMAIIEEERVQIEKNTEMRRKKASELTGDSASKDQEPIINDPAPFKDFLLKKMSEIEEERKLAEKNDKHQNPHSIGEKEKEKPVKTEVPTAEMLAKKMAAIEKKTKEAEEKAIKSAKESSSKEHKHKSNKKDKKRDKERSYRKRNRDSVSRSRSRSKDSSKDKKRKHKNKHKDKDRERGKHKDQSKYKEKEKKKETDREKAKSKTKEKSPIIGSVKVTVSKTDSEEKNISLSSKDEITTVESELCETTTVDIQKTTVQTQIETKTIEPSIEPPKVVEPLSVLESEPSDMQPIKPSEPTVCSKDALVKEKVNALVEEKQKLLREKETLIKEIEEAERMQAMKKAHVKDKKQSEVTAAAAKVCEIKVPHEDVDRKISKGADDKVTITFTTSDPPASGGVDHDKIERSGDMEPPFSLPKKHPEESEDLTKAPLLKVISDGVQKKTSPLKLGIKISQTSAELIQSGRRVDAEAKPQLEEGII